MNTFETIATVEDHGQVRVGGVPFEPGTRVEVTIRESSAMAQPDPDSPPVSVKDLLARLRGRNTEPVGPLRREELYDRQRLR